MEFISRDDYFLSENLIGYIKNNPALKALEIERLQEKLNRAQKMLDSEISLENPEEAILNIKVTRQKVHALKAAITQLNGE